MRTSGGQTADAELPQLPRDVGLGRPLVDEQRSFGHLQQDRVTLPDVEERHPQAGRRRQGLGREQLPDEERREERGGARDRPPLPPARKAPQRQQGERCPEQHTDRDAGADLGQRQPADERRAPGDVRRQPAVEPGKGERGRRHERLHERADQGQPEQRADRQRHENVAEQRPEWNAPELEPQDRRRRRGAGGRDGECIPQPLRQRVPLEGEAEARQQQEDRADGGEGELEAGLEQARGRPGEEYRRADRKEVPAIARAREQPGERGEPARDPGANDRGLPADREHIRRDRREREYLGREPGDPEQPRQPEHAEREIGDVLPRYGQEVVQAGRLEVGAKLFGQPLVLAEDDPRQDGAALPVEPRGDRPRHVRAEPVREASDPAAPADAAPVAAAENHVDAAPSQPAALVEAVLGSARRGHDGPEGQDGTLRGRAADGQLEQHALPQRALAEATHLGGSAQGEQRPSDRAGDDGGHRSRASELG